MRSVTGGRQQQTNQWRRPFSNHHFCICVFYICICICVFVFVFVYLYLCICFCLNVSLYLYMRICDGICVFVYLYLWAVGGSVPKSDPAVAVSSPRRGHFPRTCPVSPLSVNSSMRTHHHIHIYHIYISPFC